MAETSSNVDPRELAKFEPLAGRWWDAHGEFRTLHDINPVRLDYVERQAGLGGRRVVDVGCGGGILAEAMARRGARVTGIDMAGAPLAAARRHAEAGALEVDYRQLSAEALAEAEPGAFDVVTCMELLEHVPDPASVVAACARLVRPRGHVFFSTISRNPKAYLLAIVGAEYLLGLLPRGTHDYDRFIRPSELSAWARAAELTVEHLDGLHYNPLNRSARLAPGVDVNYLVHCRRDEAGS